MIAATLEEPVNEVLADVAADEPDTVDEYCPPTPTAKPAPRLTAALAYDSPEALAAYDAETRRLIGEDLTFVEAKESVCNSLKEDLKEAKADQEAAEKRLRLTIREREAQRGKPPQPKQQTIPFDGEDSMGAPLLPGEVAPQDDSWKALPIDRLAACGLSAKVCAKLAGDHGLDTLGKLSEYTEPSASGWVQNYADLKGVGAKTADKIGEAFAEFWHQWADEKKAAPDGRPTMEQWQQEAQKLPD